MNISGYSTPALLAFHAKISECLRKDDENASASKEYGVREFSDWKQFANDIEKELLTRKEPISPISW